MKARIVEYENDMSNSVDIINKCLFLNKQRSILYENTTEWDVYTNQNEILFIRTPLCRVVYSNNHIFILQIQENAISQRFYDWIVEFESRLLGDMHYDKFVRENENYHTKSMVVDADLNGVSYYDRDGVQMNENVMCRLNKKPYVIGMLYLDKKWESTSKVGFRWRIFQMREYFIDKPNICMIKTDLNVSNNSTVYYRPISQSVLPPPPPPPPPPEKYTYKPHAIVISKKVIISRLKEVNKGGFVLSQKELDDALKRFKK